MGLQVVKLNSALSFLVMGLAIFLGCSNLIDTPDHDEQILQIYIHTGFHDEIDTFSGYLQKDLVPDTVRIPFWFSTREQEIILDKMERCRFFSFPDTIHPRRDVSQSPDPGPQQIRVKYRGKDKAVVWYEPAERSFKFFPVLLEIRTLIWDIAKSRPEYKALPEPKGGYL